MKLNLWKRRLSSPFYDFQDKFYEAFKQHKSGEGESSGTSVEGEDTEAKENENESENDEEEEEEEEDDNDDDDVRFSEHFFFFRNY